LVTSFSCLVDRVAADPVTTVILTATAPQIANALDRAEKMIGWNVPLQAELVEQRLRATRRSPIIPPPSVPRMTDRTSDSQQRGLLQHNRHRVDAQGSWPGPVGSARWCHIAKLNSGRMMAHLQGSWSCPKSA
jgi:hypothetical protein